MDKQTFLSALTSRDDIRELHERLGAMSLPGGARLAKNEVLALAQASLMHGLDPFNGEIWFIPGRGLMVGIKGLRRKAREQVKGAFWVNFVELTNPEQRARLSIADGALAFECHCYDSETIRTYTDSIAAFTAAGIPWEAVKKMVGDQPYTVGIGILRPGEQTKMERAQCAMKRAEADALKRRFDVGFGVSVETDVPNDEGWVDGLAQEITDEAEPEAPFVSEQMKAALWSK